MYIKLIIIVTVVSEKDLSIYYSVCLYKWQELNTVMLKSHNFANYYSPICPTSHQQWTVNSVSVPSDEYINRTIYIGLLSATVAAHRPYWRYSKTLHLEFSAERIWNWRGTKWIKAAYEYIDTNPYDGSRVGLPNNSTWPKVGYIDSRRNFSPFTSWESFYLTCTYIFWMYTLQLYRLVQCFHCLF